jgi:NADH-quinone oxidoreductase subunit B
MGSCANCGGPYWDSYSVTKGVDQIIPSTSTCPAARRGRGAARGIVLLQERIQNEDMAARWRGEGHRSGRTRPRRREAIEWGWPIE